MIEGFSLINVRDLCANSCNGTRWSKSISLEIEFPEYRKGDYYFEKDFNMLSSTHNILINTDDTW
jgi:hypothetical protein